MKKTVLLILMMQLAVVQYGQIIADHTIVDRFDDIPQIYLNEVKKMWVSIAGESHSQAYRTGMTLLESSYPNYAVSVVESGTPEAYTSSNLRFSRATWGDYSNNSGWIYDYGEEDWFTNPTAIARTKAGLLHNKNSGPVLSVLGFGWCYDGTYPGVDGSTDAIYGTRWGGATVGSPQGERVWGLDAGDQSLTGNSVSMQTYIDATNDYINYCTSNNISTQVIFTTGPVDTDYMPGLNSGEIGYQQYLKWKYIRDYVKSNPSAILFDYADILSYNNAGIQATTSWTDHNSVLQTYPLIHSDNEGGSYVGHIGSVGAIRLAKAMWWLLARIAGWDGGSVVIPVTGITVTGTGGATTITSDNGTLQLTATVAPTDATNKTVTWSIVNGTGQATINSTGLVTAVANGTVTARATANDGSGVVGLLVITISSQVIPVTGITVTGAGGATTITSDNGTLQLTATVAPTDATNKTVTWSIVNGTGQATINSTGLVTAVANGTVTARATANDGSGVVGSLVVTVSSQAIPVIHIDISSTKGDAVINTQNGTLQLSASVQPVNATNQTVTWSIINGTGQAAVSSSGLVTAIANGTVIARATAADGSGIYGQLIITVSNQFVAVSGIVVSGEGGVTTIGSDDGTLQMVVTVSPGNATNKAVSWTLAKGSGHATISETGLLKAKSNGIVTVRATSTDNASVFGEREITLTNQIVKVSAIKVKPKSQSTDVVKAKGSIQLTAEIEPADATDQTVTWSVINGTGTATINEKGLLVGEDPGDVTVIATATDGSGVVGELIVLIDLVESIKIRYTRNEITVLVPDQLIPAKVSLHNLHGSHIQTKVIDTTECVIDISGLMPGIYVVSVYNAVVHDAAKIAISY